MDIEVSCMEKHSVEKKGKQYLLPSVFLRFNKRVVLIERSKRYGVEMECNKIVFFLTHRECS